MLRYCFSTTHDLASLFAWAVMNRAYRDDVIFISNRLLVAQSTMTLRT